MSENNNGLVFHPTGINDTHPFSEVYKAFLNSMYGSKTEDKNTEPKDEEWIWIEGYKGTDKDMKCRGYQFEIGKQFSMDEDAEIKVCESGFHLCRDLKHVFRFYNIENGNRFFKVNALVRKEDYDNYERKNIIYFGAGEYKLASKSIIFVSELSVDDIFKAYDNPRVADFTHEDKLLAIAEGIHKTIRMRDEEQLIELGYSPAFAKYCANNSKYDVAYAVGTQAELSMDMKVFAIFNNDD